MAKGNQITSFPATSPHSQQISQPAIAAETLGYFDMADGEPVVMNEVTSQREDDNRSSQRQTRKSNTSTSRNSQQSKSSMSAVASKSPQDYVDSLKSSDQPAQSPKPKGILKSRSTPDLKDATDSITAAETRSVNANPHLPNNVVAPINPSVNKVDKTSHENTYADTKHNSNSMLKTQISQAGMAGTPPVTSALNLPLQQGNQNSERRRPLAGSNGSINKLKSAMKSSNSLSSNLEKLQVTANDPVLVPKEVDVVPSGGEASTDISHNNSSQPSPGHSPVPPPINTHLKPQNTLVSTRSFDHSEASSAIAVDLTPHIMAESASSLALNTPGNKGPPDFVLQKRSGTLKTKRVSLWSTQTGGTQASTPGITPGASNANVSVRGRSSSVARRMLSVVNRQRSEKEVLVGTPVKEGHVNYMLMYDMLTGIRVSVSRCNTKPIKDLNDADFSAAHKLAFDVTGDELTPSSLYDFKFKDYAPVVFRLIRESFKIDANEYLLSLTGKYVLSELGSPGKSGSFFYFSSDYRFIIKTIHHSEHRFMRQVLRNYYEHIKENPQTLLSRIFGLHRVKLPGNKKIHFVVMGNVFPANFDIHETFDLKGSLVGRKVSEAKLQENPRSVMKDLNWLETKRKLKLGPTKKTLFVEQMEKDVKFLMKMKIMDYSLLIGTHQLAKGNKDRIRDTTLAIFEPNPQSLSRHQSVSQVPPSMLPIPAASSPLAVATTATSGAIPAQTPGTAVTMPTVGAATPAMASPLTPFIAANGHHRGSRASAIKRILAESDPIQLGPSSTRLPDDSPPERQCCVFYQDNGGYMATNSRNEGLDEVYYLGIIDIFTKYDGPKKMEHFFKGLVSDPTKISSVKPELYGTRFLDFMKAAIASD